MVSGSYNVRLDNVIHHRGTFGSVSRDDVVACEWSKLRIHGAAGEYVGTVARRVNGSIAAVGNGIVPAVISRGDDHHDSRLPCLLSRPAERVLREAFVDRPAKRQINHPNVVFALQVDCFFDGRYDSAVLAFAIGIENLEIDQIRRRGYALVSR